MELDQLKAVKDFLASAVNQPRLPGAPVGTIDPAEIYKARSNGAAPNNFSVIYEQISDAPLGQSEDIDQDARQRQLITITANPLISFSFSVGAKGMSEIFSLPSLTGVAAGATLTDSRDNLLTALQALEGDTHALEYTAAGTDGIRFEAIEGARGASFFPVTDLQATAMIEVDSMIRIHRQVKTVLVSVTISRVAPRRIDDQTAEHEMDPWYLAGKIKGFFFDGPASDILKTAGVAPARVSATREASAPKNGEWEKKAVIDLECIVSRCTYSLPGTTEELGIGGTVADCSGSEVSLSLEV